MSTILREWTVPPELAGERLDRALAVLSPESSRAFWQKAIESGRIAGPGGVISERRRPVRAGDVLRAELPEAAARTLSPEPFAFPILFEDDSVLVIDKPAGVAVHPGAGNPAGTVVNALVGRYPEIAEWTDETCADRPGIVHRLDKDTSGCLVIAKSAGAQFKLSQAFAERAVHKTYLALANGFLREPEGRIETQIGRHPVNRQKMAVLRRGGKTAVTLYRERRRGWLDTWPVSELEVTILTGRTHQIRVHLAHLGHGVLGDAVYGSGRGPEIARQLLHAWKLEFPHPVTGETLRFTSPVPADFQTVLDALRPV